MLAILLKDIIISICSSNNECKRERQYEYLRSENQGLKYLPEGIPQKVKHLSFKNNSISKWINQTSGTAPNFTNLESLDLSFNELTEIPDKLPASLKLLYLQGNRITQINTKPFSNLVELQLLDLSRNQIGYVEDGALKMINSFTNLTIYLDSNKLSNPVILKIISVLERPHCLTLQGNLIECDLKFLEKHVDKENKLVSIHGWIRSHTHYFTKNCANPQDASELREYLCTGPSPCMNLALKDFGPDRIDCILSTKDVTTRISLNRGKTVQGQLFLMVFCNSFTCCIVKQNFLSMLVKCTLIALTTRIFWS